MTAHNDCCDASHGPPLLQMEQALDLLLGHAHPLADSEAIPLSGTLGRVLAKPVTSPIDVPGWDNSAMDGYAVRTGDLAERGGRLRVTQRIPAGSVGSPVEPGTAARIFTGAPMPEQADAVVAQEACDRVGDDVIVPCDISVGANVRRAGEDICAGSEILGAGTRLAPQHLGLAASVGVALLNVRRRLKVAVFSSGDELRMPGEPLASGQIYNSNRFTLCGMLQRLGCETLDLGIIEDTLGATKQALARGAEQADLVLASGGVSVGEEDHVKPAVEQLGSLDLWKIAIRPGKPLAFGHIGDTPFIGSPGNPVSLFVTFCLFARPFILRMQGISGPVIPQPLRATAGFDWPRPDKRREFQRARIAVGDDGLPVVEVYPSRSSAVLSSVAWAQGLVVIPEGKIIAKGDPVDYLPFSELLTSTTPP